MNDKRLESGYWALRIAFGVVPIVAGLDKFTNLLTDWAGYLSPLAKQLLPVSPQTFMHLAGIIEVVVGLAVLTRFTRIAAYVACAWLVCIALNLVASGHFLDVAARDAVMAVGAFALGRLAEVHDEATAREAHTAAMRPAKA
ncbi:MAG TPA: DoxX family protein [Anaeromyxobacteraceae bacterium]|jgi:uncharacterized membrane protein YphA (DoxX/SURF4 family)|nr:DoxX family protein [Anaeromyxobacteraceae bacterium]